MQPTTQNWHTFYKSRINSSYQQYFEQRYKPLIDTILKQAPLFVREEGIGIGSVSKALRPHIPGICYGYDNSQEMVNLCLANNPGMLAFKDCIISPETGKYNFLNRDLIVTHGVLEHFEDWQITKIFDRYRRHGNPNIHYVPTDQYSEPSFGDERLMPVDFWLDLVKPYKYQLFNDNKDLLLINL
jgi:hypothetical protein